MRFRRVIALALVLGVALSVSAQATPKIQRLFGTRYPEAKGKLAVCATCHTDKLPEMNAYGTDLKKAGADFAKVEPLDSDGDGAKNLAEIRALTSPGDPKSSPAKSDSTSARPDTAKAGEKKPEQKKPE